MRFDSKDFIGSLLFLLKVKEANSGRLKQKKALLSGDYGISRNLKWCREART